MEITRKFRGTKEAEELHSKIVVWREQICNNSIKIPENNSGNLGKLGYNNGACYCGSMAEQHIRNVQVEGSIPSSSSNKSGLPLMRMEVLFFMRTRQSGNRLS